MFDVIFDDDIPRQQIFEDTQLYQPWKEFFLVLKMTLHIFSIDRFNGDDFVIWISDVGSSGRIVGSWREENPKQLS